MMTSRQIALIKRYAEVYRSRSARQLADDAKLEFTPYLAAIVTDVRAEQARAGR